MATETIEAVWKSGRIIPLADVKVEDNTHVFVTVPVAKSKKHPLLSLAGVWKDDDKTYNIFKKVIEGRKNFKLRRWSSA